MKNKVTYLVPFNGFDTFKINLSLGLIDPSINSTIVSLIIEY